MSARYLIRLDDACPTMKKENWDKIEDILDKYGIKPIVGVIPENKDPMLIKDEIDYGFWKKVGNWTEKKWTIAMHGYQHLYHKNSSDILKINKFSEFSGLTYDEQKEKIYKGYEIFEKNNIRPQLFFAPAHSYDKNTLKVIKENTCIKIISDGIALLPFKEYGLNFIPQQIWRFRKLPFGLWTCCFHPDNMRKEDFIILENFIKKNIFNFIKVSDIEKFKKIRFLDRVFRFFYYIILRFKL